MSELLPHTVAVLLAAGRSARMGGPVQKTLLTLDGEPVVLRSARALLGAPSVRALIVVTRRSDRAEVEAALAPIASRVLVYVDGGDERVDSVRAGVAAAPAGTEVVLVHDAARCLVRSARVEEVARAAAVHGAAVLATRVRDTIKRSTDGVTVAATLSRAELWAAQTPQGARAGLFADALACAADEGFVPTDDVALIERYAGTKVALVEGDDDNLKLTTPTDVVIAEALLARRAAAREGAR